MEKKNTVEIIEIRFAVGSETSTHKVFVRNSGRTIRSVVEPICLSKAVSIDTVGVYIDKDRSNSLPLDYDVYALAGHCIHVVDYRAPEHSIDELDGKLTASKSKEKPTQYFKLKHSASAVTGSLRPNQNSSTSPLVLRRKKSGGDGRVSSPIVGRRGPKAQLPGLPPTTVGEMFTQQRPPSGSNIGRTTSNVSMAQGRRQKSSDIAPTQLISGKLLGLSEDKNHHSKDQSIDDGDSERHKKSISAAPGEDGLADISPGGTLTKAKNSYSRLSRFSNPPQNSKEREKMEKLADLLDLWEKQGLPKPPDLAEMPKYDPTVLEIEDHWTTFIDGTGLTQRQKDQQEALWELLYTEIEYIKALHVIHELFISCLLNIQNEMILNEIDTEAMFGNITTLANINSEFWSSQLLPVLNYSRKNKCLFKPSLLKPAFTSFGERFKAYTTYCMEQKKCSDYVKKTYQKNTMFKAFVVWAEAQKQCNRLKLHDLLVKPMQRLTRYGLLLRAITKKTDDESVKLDLREMIDNVDQFVTAVDQTLTKTDEKEKLLRTAARIEPYEVIDTPLVDSECSKILSQTYMNLDLMCPMPGCGTQLRYVLMEGPLRLRDMNTKSDVYCILFTDMLLFTKVSKRDTTKLKIFKPPIRVDSLSIHEMKENPYVFLVHLTDFGVAQAAYTLHGDNISKWVKMFKKAQTLYMKCKEQARKESANASITDLELDDIGFSGPLERKASDAVFTHFSESGGYDSPKVQRTPSYNSLNGTEDELVPLTLTTAHSAQKSRKTLLPTVTGEEFNDAAEASVSKSVSSPDIGRKHHTLPPNYKHPPLIKVHRKSSSSSGESHAPNDRQRSKERNRNRSAERHTTTGASMNSALVNDKTNSRMQREESDDSSEQKVTWQLGDATSDNNNSNSDKELASTDINCDNKPRLTGTVSNQHGGDSSSNHSDSSSSLTVPSRHQNLVSSKSDGFDTSDSPRLSHSEILRIRKSQLQTFLSDSAPGVEI